MKAMRLPDGELEVMKAIWKCTVPVKRGEIEQILFQQKPMAVTTLLTMLTRLSEKGFLEIRKDGRSSVYIPLISEHDYQISQSRRFFSQVFEGNISAFASALSDSGLSREDIEELRELLRSDKL